MLSTFSLTKDQTKALNSLIKFINKEYVKNDINSYCAILSGSAGTGKTTLTKELIKVIQRKRMIVAGVAPTHKARKVLDAMINTNCFINIPTLTVASLLYKVREHSNIGTKKYSKSKGNKICNYQILLIDEISMVSDDDYDTIVKYANINRTKIRKFRNYSLDIYI